jgi:TPR repeat protein
LTSARLQRQTCRILLLLLLAGRALAAAPDTQALLTPAQTLLDARNYSGAYAAYQRAAARTPVALFVLGQFHLEGWGRPRDPAAACRWFEKAAAAGVPAALHRWGDCLADGIVRAPDIAGAIAAYRRAADGGHLISLCTIADFYLQGRDVPQDGAMAVALCTQAAQAHSPPAMLRLGDYYRNGVGMPPDLTLARYWYSEAAQRGVSEAQYRIGLMLAQAEGGAADLNAALYWLESAAGAGHAAAYLPTARLYANAPVLAATGALAPEHLAKIYLWTEAAKARAPEAEQRAAAQEIEAQILAVMPAEWRITLDRQVDQHLRKFAE